MATNEVGVLDPEELIKVAKDEVNEEPERIEKDINAIKEWLAKQPHLQGIRSGTYILRFLDSIRDLTFFEKGYDRVYGPNHVLQVNCV